MKSSRLYAPVTSPALKIGNAPPATGARRFPLRALLVLTAFGALLRFATLGLQSYWNDEAVTAALLDHRLTDVLHAVPDSESTPPFYYVAAWIWTRAFGLGEVGLRSLSALAGTLTIPVAYLLAARLASARAGLVAAALVAVNPMLWWYSQEARAYALLVLLTAVTMVAFVDVLEERRGPWLWAIAAALALATHYFAFLVVAPQAAWLAWRAWRSRPPARSVVLALGGVAVVGLALLPLFVHQASNDRAQFIAAAAGSLPFRLAQVPKQFLIGFDAPLERAATVAAALLAATALALLVARADRRERRGAALAAAIAASTVAVPAVLALAGADYVLARNLLPALVPALTVVAIGAGCRRAGRSGLAIATALCALSVGTIVAVVSTPGYQRDDWRGVADVLGPPARDRAIVVTPADGAAALEWYMRNARTTGETRTVAEIDAVGLAPRLPGQKPKPPRGPAPVAAGFTQVRRIERPTFTVVVSRSATPTPVSNSFAAAQRLSLQLPAAVIYQPHALRSSLDAAP
jgi:hypothetical protein